MRSFRSGLVVDVGTTRPGLNDDPCVKSLLILIWSVHILSLGMARRWHGICGSADNAEHYIICGRTSPMTAHRSRTLPPPDICFPRRRAAAVAVPRGAAHPGVYGGSAALLTPAQWNTHIHLVPTGKRASRVPPHQSSSAAR